MMLQITPQHKLLLAVQSADFRKGIDGNGVWLCMKRFSKGVLSWWPSAETETWELNSSQIQVLLMQGDPRLMMTPDEWRKLPWNALSKGIDFNVGHQAALASV